MQHFVAEVNLHAVGRYTGRVTAARHERHQRAYFSFLRMFGEQNSGLR